MAKQVTIRRGTTADHSGFAGAEGEITVDTTKDTVVVHDGVTDGGFPLALESAALSDAEIKTAYENNADTNEFSDAEQTKLAGIGTIATQDADAVAITGGSVTGITDLTIADGGTGASDASTARSNLGSTTVGDAVFVATDEEVARAALLVPNKNAIINGNFNIWQRGTSFASVANGEHTTDRFIWVRSEGVGVVAIGRSGATGEGTTEFSLAIEVTTVDTSVNDTDRYFLEYRVEGYDIQRFGFGTADAKVFTLSFWVRSHLSGTHAISFRNTSEARHYVVEYTVDAANTWEFKTITLTADTTGTWDTDNGLGLRITWPFQIGLNFHTTAGSWDGSGKLATSSTVNLMGTLGTFRISQVQLELGSVATEFERRSQQQELAMAQRYYQKTFAQGTTPAQNAGRVGTIGYRARVSGAGNQTEAWRFIVKMRASPSVTFFNPQATNALWRNISTGTDSGTASAINASDWGFVINNVQEAGDNIPELLEVHATADAEL